MDKGMRTPPREAVAKWLFQRIVIEERESSTATWEDTTEEFREGWRKAADDLLAVAELEATDV